MSTDFRKCDVKKKGTCIKFLCRSKRRHNLRCWDVNIEIGIVYLGFDNGMYKMCFLIKGNNTCHHLFFPFLVLVLPCYVNC